MHVGPSWHRRPPLLVRTNGRLATACCTKRPLQPQRAFPAYCGTQQHVHRPVGGSATAPKVFLKLRSCQPGDVGVTVAKVPASTMSCSAECNRQAGRRHPATYRQEHFYQSQFQQHTQSPGCSGMPPTVSEPAPRCRRAQMPPARRHRRCRPAVPPLAAATAAAATTPAAHQRRQLLLDRRHQLARGGAAVGVVRPARLSKRPVAAKRRWVSGGGRFRTGGKHGIWVGGQ